MKLDREWLTDAGERIGWTFLQAGIAAVGSEALAAGLVAGDVSVARGFAVGGLAAALSTVKALAAKRVGDPHSAATRKAAAAGR